MSRYHIWLGRRRRKGERRSAPSPPPLPRTHSLIKENTFLSIESQGSCLSLWAPIWTLPATTTAACGSRKAAGRTRRRRGRGRKLLQQGQNTAKKKLPPLSFCLDDVIRNPWVARCVWSTFSPRSGVLACTATRILLFAAHLSCAKQVLWLSDVESPARFDVCVLLHSLKLSLFLAEQAT